MVVIGARSGLLGRGRGHPRGERGCEGLSQNTAENNWMEEREMGASDLAEWFLLRGVFRLAILSESLCF